MSEGDTHFGKETIYKGFKMRSRFETKIAYFLDCLKIKWEYEPKTFLLSSGIPYKPDFYLPELKMWIESKGVVGEHNKEISKTFVEDNNTELLMIAPTKTYWFSMKDFTDGFCEDNVVSLGKCSNCGSYFFTSNIGWYFCRKCKTHEGDHDIGFPLIKCVGWEQYILEDFGDLKSIKRGLQSYGINS